MFASYRERVGQGTLDLDMPDGMSVGALAREIVEQHPSIIGNPANVVVAVNEEYQNHDYELRDGDEVAFIPPVSGGDR